MNSEKRLETRGLFQRMGKCPFSDLHSGIQDKGVIGYITTHIPSLGLQCVSFLLPTNCLQEMSCDQPVVLFSVDVWGSQN